MVGGVEPPVDLCSAVGLGASAVRCGSPASLEASRTRQGKGTLLYHGYFDGASDDADLGGASLASKSLEQGYEQGKCCSARLLDGCKRTPGPPRAAQVVLRIIRVQWQIGSPGLGGGHRWVID